MSGKGRTVVEAIGVISIVASLIFVGYEVRQANQLARLEAQREMANAWHEVNLSMALDPAFPGMLARVWDGATEADFEPGERASLALTFVGLGRGWELSFKQLGLGILDPDDVAFPPPDDLFFNNAYYRGLWSSGMRDIFSEEFAAFWEERFNLTSEPSQP